MVVLKQKKTHEITSFRRPKNGLTTDSNEGSRAMKMVGYKTESIYRRYAIADEKSMKEAGKLDQFYAIDQQPTETSK
jgi:hypothetical protein